MVGTVCRGGAVAAVLAMSLIAVSARPNQDFFLGDRRPVYRGQRYKSNNLYSSSRHDSMAQKSGELGKDREVKFVTSLVNKFTTVPSTGDKSTRKEEKELVGDFIRKTLVEMKGESLEALAASHSRPGPRPIQMVPLGTPDHWLPSTPSNAILVADTPDHLLPQPPAPNSYHETVNTIYPLKKPSDIYHSPQKPADIYYGSHKPAHYPAQKPSNDYPTHKPADTVYSTQNPPNYYAHKKPGYNFYFNENSTKYTTDLKPGLALYRPIQTDEHAYSPVTLIVKPGTANKFKVTGKPIFVTETSTPCDKKPGATVTTVGPWQDEPWYEPDRRPSNPSQGPPVFLFMPSPQSTPLYRPVLRPGGAGPLADPVEGGRPAVTVVDDELPVPALPAVANPPLGPTLILAAAGDAEPEVPVLSAPLAAPGEEAAPAANSVAGPGIIPVAPLAPIRPVLQPPIPTPLSDPLSDPSSDTQVTTPKPNKPSSSSSLLDYFASFYTVFPLLNPFIFPFLIIFLGPLTFILFGAFIVAGFLFPVIFIRMIFGLATGARRRRSLNNPFSESASKFLHNLRTGYFRELGYT